MMTEPAPPLRDEERAQRQLYDSIADDYVAAAWDPPSQRYLDRFISRFLFRGIPLAGKTVCDAACGSGTFTSYLLKEGASVVGLDISERIMEQYARRFPGCSAVCRSIFDTGLPDEIFDCVCMAGALHHFHPRVEAAIDEVLRILKPGGFFCFCEPHTGSLPDAARRIWYRYDRVYFEQNEAAIDPPALLRATAGRFRPVSQRFGGNLAYLFSLQALFLRIPARLKRFYSPLLLPLESAITPFQGRRLSCFTICQWQKAGLADDRPAL